MRCNYMLSLNKSHVRRRARLADRAVPAADAACRCSMRRRARSTTTSSRLKVTCSTTSRPSTSRSARVRVSRRSGVVTPMRRTCQGTKGRLGSALTPPLVSCTSRLQLLLSHSVTVTLHDAPPLQRSLEVQEWTARPQGSRTAGQLRVDAGHHRHLPLLSTAWRDAS